MHTVTLPWFLPLTKNCDPRGQSSFASTRSRSTARWFSWEQPLYDVSITEGQRWGVALHCTVDAVTLFVYVVLVLPGDSHPHMQIDDR